MLTDISERSFKHLQFQYVTSHRNKSRGSEVVNSIQQTQVRIVSGVDVVCIRDEEAKIDAITYNASISLRSINAVRQVRVRSVTCDYTARPTLPPLSRWLTDVAFRTATSDSSCATPPYGQGRFAGHDVSGLLTVEFKRENGCASVYSRCKRPTNGFVADMLKFRSRVRGWILSDANAKGLYFIRIFQRNFASITGVKLTDRATVA